MKLLFDQNLSFKLCRALADLFPDSSQVQLIGLERASDLLIWNHAKATGFMLVSLDSDVAEMAALRGAPPKVIWLRCGNQSNTFVENLLRKHAETIAAFEFDGNAACLELY